MGKYGQSTLEFVWLIVTVIVVVLALQPILKRAIGGRFRSSIDQVSQLHFDPTDSYAIRVRSDGARQDTVGRDAGGSFAGTGESRSSVIEGTVELATAGEKTTQHATVGQESLSGTADQFIDQ